MTNINIKHFVGCFYLSSFISKHNTFVLEAVQILELLHTNVRKINLLNHVSKLLDCTSRTNPILRVKDSLSSQFITTDRSGR